MLLLNKSFSDHLLSSDPRSLRWIETKAVNLNGLKNLRILSLGRNNIKNLNGLEAVGDTLEELWISYNFIEKLKGIHVMKKLKILYMSNNLVKDWAEFVKLAELPCLEDLVFVGNPLEEKHSAEGNWVEEATKRVPKLKKLDGTPVIKEDEEEDNWHYIFHFVLTYLSVIWIDKFCIVVYFKDSVWGKWFLKQTSHSYLLFS